ncbi:MAG: SBBP repeat-containing protein [Methanothrix sp.]|nr:SBBP repeat-containing protein [Methanothrix sp.]
MLKMLLVFSLVLIFTLPLFAQSVDTVWVRRYNGTADSTDVGSDLEVDSYGNVYVTGYSRIGASGFDYVTIKYLSNGDTAWMRSIDGGWVWNRIAVDQYSNAYMAGSIYAPHSYVTAKYLPNGDLEWVNTFNGPSSLSDLVLDAHGNAYVTGGGYDYVTIKYRPNGDTAWVRSYNGPGDLNDWAKDLAVDERGNVYVTGQSDGTGNWWGDDFATIKYDSLGNQLWVSRYNGPADSTDQATAIALDASGNVYVTGISYGIGTGLDWATVKYDSLGNELWVRRYNGSANEDDRACDIATDDSGYIYVLGDDDKISGQYYNTDYVVIKYLPSGDTAWLRRYDGSPGGITVYDTPRDLTLDEHANAYVTGLSDMGTGTGCGTVKFTPDGNIAWSTRYYGPGPFYYMGQGLAVEVDDSAYVYVTGSSPGLNGELDFVTIKYIQFWRGDANRDSKVTVSDVVYIVNYLFKGGPPPNPLLSGDANCDGKVTVADVVFLINYLFKGGPAPNC